MTSGKFITLEGGEGAGKTTQAAFLADRLRTANIEVLQTREPGGTPRAEAIREVLLSGRAKPFGALGEAILFYAARESHLELAIRPALAAGTWVVCDRFSDSTRAYQGVAGGLSLRTIETFEAAVVGATKPDLTLIFDIDPEIGLRRTLMRLRASGGMQKGGGKPTPDRFETMNIAFHRSLREAFYAIAKAEPERCVILDAARPAEKISDQVWGMVRERFKL